MPNCVIHYKKEDFSQRLFCSDNEVVTKTVCITATCACHCNKTFLSSTTSFLSGKVDLCQQQSMSLGISWLFHNNTIKSLGKVHIYANNIFCRWDKEFFFSTTWLSPRKINLSQHHLKSLQINTYLPATLQNRWQTYLFMPTI